jgi:xylitol oxidase
LNLRNWAGNIEYSAARLHEPGTVEQLQDVVAGSRKLRVLGTRHSFNRIADSQEDLVSLARLAEVHIGEDRRSVTVGGGTRYGELCLKLDRYGLAVPNLASLPHISIAGACATATHGSGDRNPCLAASVSGVELVRADGEIQSFSRAANPELFDGLVVNLGAPGVVLRITLDVVPAFEVRQVVYENLAWESLDSHFDAITSSAYSVSLFTDWSCDSVEQVWRKLAEGSEDEPEWLGATRAERNMHPIGHMSPENCTEQAGAAGRWYDRLPHFRLDHTPSAGEELQSEYLVTRRHALDAIQAIRGLRDQIALLLQISEIRTIAADTLWLSPFYQEDCIGLHFTWVKDWPAVESLLPLLEEKLAPFDARPHWGKLFTMEPKRIQLLYPRLEDFRRLVSELDPGGKFRNPFVDKYVFGIERAAG